MYILLNKLYITVTSTNVLVYQGARVELLSRYLSRKSNKPIKSKNIYQEKARTNLSKVRRNLSSETKWRNLLKKEEETVKSEE